MKPDSFTITTFWLDWLLMPIMLVGAWQTARWALTDARQAKKLEAEGEYLLPAYTYSIPLLVAAVAWLIAGMGTLIREDYWEMRVIFGAFLLWTLCCILGASLLFFLFLQKGKKLGTAGRLNLVGLLLMSLLMVLPGLIDHSSPAYVTLVGHIWFLLLAVCVALLMGAVILGFPYKFPLFPLGLGAFFLIGWGGSEIAFSQASFPWLVRIWKLHIGLEYIDVFPISRLWQFIGTVKVLAGITAAVMLLIVLRLKRA